MLRVNDKHVPLAFDAFSATVVCERRVEAVALVVLDALHHIGFGERIVVLGDGAANGQGKCDLCADIQRNARLIGDFAAVLHGAGLVIAIASGNFDPRLSGVVGDGRPLVIGGSPGNRARQFDGDAAYRLAVLQYGDENHNGVPGCQFA